MYHGTPFILPAAGITLSVWAPLAGFALIMLGIALWRFGGTFKKSD